MTKSLPLHVACTALLLTWPSMASSAGETFGKDVLLTEPIKVPAGSKIVVVAHYDNSTSNRTVTTPSKPGSDMFMPTMQFSVERAAVGVP